MNAARSGLKRALSVLLGMLAVCWLCLVLFANLEISPPVWWDEGWTLLAAKNWVDTGHYGQINDGVQRSPGLSAALPGVWLSAFSFELFGVTVQSARVAAVCVSLTALALMVAWSWKLFGKTTALLTALFAVILHHYPHMSLLYWGRQVLSEMGMMALLLAGMLSFASSSRQPFRDLLLSSIFWGLALQTKQQTIPFWVFAMVFAGVTALRKMPARSLLRLFLACCGALIFFALFPLLERCLGGDSFIPKQPIPGLLLVTAWIPVWEVRLYALRLVFDMGLPTLAGLLYAARKIFLPSQPPRASGELGLMLSAYWAFAASWLVWYLVAAAHWDRYLFPAVFLSTPFVALLVQRLFTWASRRLDYTLRDALRFPRRTIDLLLRLSLMALLVNFALKSLQHTIAATQAALQPVDSGLAQVWDDLNLTLPPDATVESYDSEVFFGIQRNYHYPDDALSVRLIRNQILDEPEPNTYTPPERENLFIVVGPFSRMWQVYDAYLLESGFHLWRELPGYQIYTRENIP